MRSGPSLSQNIRPHMLRILFTLLLAALHGLAQAQSPADSSNRGSSHALAGVSVSSGSQRLREQINSVQMGKAAIPTALLLRAPSMGGESDIVKALQLTPGVKRGTDGGIGMYVRGGGNDENLIMLDGAPVYNAGHLLGFFSLFNPGAIREADMYKSAFPARYGGRLSSVLDLSMRDGSMNDFKAGGNIGLISSSVVAEGPIVRNKLFGMIAARRTYIDQVFRYIPYHFYDLNGRFHFVASATDHVYFSGYLGDDELKMNGGSGDSLQSVRTGMKLGNNTATLRWAHKQKDGHWNSDLSAYYSRFRYDIGGSFGGSRLDVKSSIQDFGMRGEMRYEEIDGHRLTEGFSVVHHGFRPNIVQSSGTELDKFPSRPGKLLSAVEAAVYAADEWTINSDLSLMVGMRLSGALTKDSYYVNPEPRLGLRYKLDENNSFKLSYSRMVQYMHLVSSSSLTLPTDLWYPVSNHIRPGISDQYSVGYYHTLPEQSIGFTAEAYYKRMKNLVEYREGAQLVLNDDFESELLHGRGEAYGLELLLTKTKGRFTGWLGYSLAWSTRQFDSLNKGKTYYSRFDRRHDLSLVMLYDISKRFNCAGTLVWATGQPFTGQRSQYLVPKPDMTGVDALPIYTERNEMRMDSAFRIDLDLGYKFTFLRKLRGEAHLSMYNVLNRTQPDRVTKVWDAQKQQYRFEQRGIFGNITTLSFNFRI
jgi:hypothetical protein